MEYTTTLVNKLEDLKTQYASDDAITDDVAGQAFVEQFGLDLFNRADNVVRANKTSRQTADTFLAASTILDLVHIWGRPSAEIASKVKFAKFHAVRILKAVKAGEDPNLSNPEPAPVQDESTLVELDPKDPEVKDITGAYQAPSVEAVPDDDIRGGPQELPGSAGAEPQSEMKNGISTWNAASLPGPVTDDSSTTNATTQALPADLTDPNPRAGSIGGGYFPEVPIPLGDVSSTDITDTDSAMPLPSAASHDPDIEVPVQVQAPSGLGSAPDIDPQDFYNNTTMDIDSAAPTAPSFSDIAPSQPAPQVAPAPDFAKPQPPVVPPPASKPQARNVPATKPLWSSSVASSRSATPQPPAQTASTFQAPPSAPTASTAQVDDMAIADAQKHARWAISALNFEDVPTAIKELQVALRALGGM